MNNKGFAICLILFFSMIFTPACQLDTDGDALFTPSSGDAADAGEGDSSTWPETGTPDADAAPDVVPDNQIDSPDDVATDVPNDVALEADAVEDSPLDATEEDAPEDSPLDAPPDVVEADAPPHPVDCFGVSTEAGDVMICGSLPGGTAKSLMFKAEIIPAGSGQSIPFKSVCWSEAGVANLACFPCPGPNACWPIPDGGFPNAPAHSGDMIKFQPGIADGPGLDMKNTLCELSKCYQGTYIVYSGHTEVCRVNTDGTLAGNAVYEGTGTNVKIVCTL
ncbi:MAG: hypothetical protein P1P90_03115 [Patescibacteria group bacterium]|nr:hypothetical protein [Patescibacteria group bacterium]